MLLDSLRLDTFATYHPKWVCWQVGTVRCAVPARVQRAERMRDDARNTPNLRRCEPVLHRTIELGRSALRVFAPAAVSKRLVS